MELMRIIIAQIAQTIGYSSTQNAPLELLQDILHKFMQEFAQDLHSQMEHANRTEPTLKDARLTLKSLSVNVQELLDYIGNVEPVPFVRDIPAFPVKRASNLNFLKPGSAETLTRPVYIFEYLPPMQPNTAAASCSVSQAPYSDQEQEGVDGDASKRVVNQEGILGNSVNTGEATSSTKLLNFPAKDIAVDFEGHTVREIRSVVMTSGGFISPAIEGKLPESIVPDIIVKLKGLDAPPPPSPPPSPPASQPLSGTETNTKDKLMVSAETTLFSEKEQKTLTSSDGKGIHSPAFVSTTETASVLPTVSTVPDTAKTTKKIKKQKHAIAIAAGSAGENVGLNSSKAHEKAQRKAMKMFQKLSKSNSDGGNALMLLKKSKKHLNRGVLASLPDGSAERLQLEKLLKKQARQRQKQQQFDVKPFAYADGLGNTTANLVEEASTSFTPVITEKAMLPLPAAEIGPTGGECEPSLGVKLPSEPDRNKLNIFKKISKQKPSTPTPPVSGLALFGSGSPLISLPSGTTITPAPAALSVSVDSLMTNSAQQQSQQFSPLTISAPATANTNLTSAATALGVEILNIDGSKPKKRGRKPGGKNQTKQTNLGPNILMQQPSKKIKPSKAMIGALGQGFAPPLSLITAPEPANLLAMEPLNLSHAPQFPETPIQPKAKEKKERKKYKSTKYDPLQIQGSDNFPSDDMHMRISPTKRIASGPNQYVGLGVGMGVGGLPPSLYPSNSIPLLPLLSFTPRPGLIPSGPGLFPAPAGGLPSFGQSSVGLPPFIQFPGGTGSTEPIVNRPPPMNANDMKPIGYCPVAPLVPESMKLTSPDNQKKGTFGTKMKPLSATGNPGDPIEVSDDSDESTAASNSLKASQVLSAFDGTVGRPNIIQPSQLPYTAVGSTRASTPTPLVPTKHETSNKQLSSTVMPRPTPVFEPHSAVKKLKKQTKMSDSLIAPSATTITPSVSSISPSPFNIQNFMGSDKYSLAGGADLIPLSRVESGLAYSLQTVPVTSLAAGATSGTSSVPSNQMNLNNPEEIQPQRPQQQFVPSFGSFEDVTITPANSVLNPITSSDELRVRKLHKKLKKPKEGKIKKKKDKKEKSKSKERLIGSDLHLYTSEKPAKGLDKKMKKDKKKDKQIPITSGTGADSDPTGILPLNALQAVTTSSVTVSSSVPAAVQISNTPKMELSPNQVPKLTLKLSGKSTPLPMEHEPTATHQLVPQIATSKKDRDRDREHSPELARFSPLVTGPPKPKSESLLSINTPASVSNSGGTPLALPMQMTALPNTLHTHGTTSTASNPSGWLTSGSGPPASATLSASSVLLPQQLMLAANPLPPSSLSSTLVSPKVAVSPSKVDSTGLQTMEANRPSSYVDAEGNRIWICPACGKVDDGSAMIGCDGCDAWYHWICVGIQVAPKDNDDWFCRVCITRKKVSGSERKKKRNKKK